MQELPEISQYNAKLIKRFIEKYKALPTEPGKSRILTVETKIRTIARLLGKNLDSLSEQDLQNLNTKMREREMKSASDYRGVLKKLLALQDREKNRKLLESDYLKTVKKKANGSQLVNPDKFWSETECNSYLKESKRHSLRQSAWAGLWVSSGARPHELLSLRKNDIEFKDPGALVIRIREGKTGRRSIVLEGATAKGVWYYVKDYLDSLQDSEKLFKCCYRSMEIMHKKLCRRAGIGKDKAWNLYNMRKQRLTQFYSDNPLPIAAAMAGHVVGSPVLKHYIGVNEKMILERKLPKVEMRACPNPSCGFVNEPHCSQCQKCGSPLDRQAFAAIFEKNMNELIDIKMKLLKKDFELKLLKKGRGKK